MNAKLIVSAVLILGSLASFAGTSADLFLKGSVAVQNNISVSTTSAATTLDIINGNSDLKVATVSETSNNNVGYDITMSSLNAGKLVHSSDSSKYANYGISYNGLSFVTPTTAPAVVKTVSSVDGLMTVTSDVKINLAANPSAPAGDYADTITFSIVAR